MADFIIISQTNNCLSIHTFVTPGKKGERRGGGKMITIERSTLKDYHSFFMKFAQFEE